MLIDKPYVVLAHKETTFGYTYWDMLGSFETYDKANKTAKLFTEVYKFDAPTVKIMRMNKDTVSDEPNLFPYSYLYPNLAGVEIGRFRKLNFWYVVFPVCLVETDLTFKVRDFYLRDKNSKLWDECYSRIEVFNTGYIKTEHKEPSANIRSFNFD